LSESGSSLRRPTFLPDSIRPLPGSSLLEASTLVAGLSALDISGTMARRPPERDIAVGDAVAGGGVHGGLVPMSTLYEREHAFVAISATITSPSQGLPGMPFIAAGPGPGKTTLLAWARAQEDGVEVRLASCTEVEVFRELGIFSSGGSSRESRKARLDHYADILSWRGSGLLFPCCWRSMTCTRRIWRCASGDLPAQQAAAAIWIARHPLQPSLTYATTWLPQKQGSRPSRRATGT